MYPKWEYRLWTDKDNRCRPWCYTCALLTTNSQLSRNSSRAAHKPLHGHFGDACP